MSHGRLHQRRVKNAFDKKVRLCKFNKGDLALKKGHQALKDNRRKWAPNYEGSFVVKKFFRRSPGARQHWWHRITLTCEHQCRQPILCLTLGAIKRISACLFLCFSPKFLVLHKLWSQTCNKRRIDKSFSNPYVVESHILLIIRVLSLRSPGVPRALN